MIFSKEKNYLLISVGDGAGVGKGRTIAGIIFENYLRGRKKAIWISVSNDLKYDAERDLRDIGASNISVHALNKVNDCVSMEYNRICISEEHVQYTPWQNSFKDLKKKCIYWIRDNFWSINYVGFLSQKFKKLIIYDTAYSIMHKCKNTYIPFTNFLVNYVSDSLSSFAVLFYKCGHSDHYFYASGKSLIPRLELKSEVLLQQFRLIIQFLISLFSYSLSTPKSIRL